MATLLGRLMARPDEDLGRLAVVWGARLPGRGHAEDVAALYRTMTDTWALRDVLEGLSAAAARQLWAMARERENEVAGGSDAIEPASHEAVAELVRSGLLHPAPEGSAVVLAEEIGARLRRLADERRGGDRSASSLASLVATLDSGELAAAAERWGVAVVPGTQPRAMVEAALLEATAAPLAVEDLLAGFDRTDRAVYDLLVRSSRPLPLAEVRRRLVLPPAALRRALRHLHDGLVAWESWVERERRLFVPAELRPRPRRTPAVLAAVPAEPAGWRHPLALAWDTLAWLRLSARAPGLPITSPEIVPAGYPLWHGDGPASRAAYLALVRAATADLTSAATEDGTSQSLTARQADLFTRWRAAAQPWGVPVGVTPVDDWSTLRETTLAVLAGLKPGAWYPIEALVARIASDRTAPVVESRSGKIRRPPAPAPRALADLLQTTLVWLGLLEPGRETSRRRPVARLTPLGAGLLGAGPAPPAGEAALEAEPSLRLLIYEADATLLWPLLAFAEPEALDRVSVYRLTRASIAAGRAAGLTADTMLATLSRAARHELPQNLVYSLRDWARAARHARLGRALVLTFDDDRARDEALHLPALRILGVTPLPQARLLLPTPDDAAEARALATLRELGFAE